MKFLSLFSGVGGFGIGLENAGMQCAGQVEIDDFCNRVLEKHWPDVKREKDIRNVTKDTFGTVGLVCGGFPCQPFSVAGKQRGTEDDRYLWPEMFRVIKEYGPTWCILENVTGIITMALDNVLFDLESIGYQVQTFIIPACAVNAPHRRNRVWVVGYSEKFKRNEIPSQETREHKESKWPVGRSSVFFQDTQHDGRNAAQNTKGVESRIDTPTGPGRAKQSQGPGCSPGGVENVAHSTGTGLQKRKASQLVKPLQNAERGNIAIPTKDVADTEIKRVERNRSSGEQEPETHVGEGVYGCNGSGSGTENREFKSRLGRVVDGISSRMDRIGIEPDIPRITTISKNRAKRLKALGNAVVPLIPEIIGRAIMEVGNA